MQTRDGLIIRRTLTTLLGLAVLGWAPSLPAFAQSTPKRTKSVSRRSAEQKRQMEQKDVSEWYTDDDNDLRMDPAPMSYPQAAPGSLNLYHWTDYTHTRIAEGSAWEEKEARERMRDERRRKRAEMLHSMMGTYSPSMYNSNDYSNPSSSTSQPESKAPDTNSVSPNNKSGVPDETKPVPPETDKPTTPPNSSSNTPENASEFGI